ncbi:beta-galactosidase [Bacteroides sedimenti]|uniref:Beta-galactosidase n=2 Tax=Bacteroides sedimenti TaxID=2136147 RepID=A0ABM8IDJ4_9BACE
MTIEGKDVFIYSAAFHYFRCPKALWRDRFRKIKKAGFNTVETYVPWNWHEMNMPKNVNDFSKCDFSDLKAWLKMAQEEFGFYTIVRPGPFICAEWAGGAHPRWLGKFCPDKYETSFWLRSDNPEYIKWSKHWYDAVCPIFASEQITNKPKGGKGIILVQLENEYIYFDMASEGKIRYLKALYQAAKSNGINVPLFTCVTPEARDCKDPQISQVFDMDNQYIWWNMQESKNRIEDLKRQQPDAPAFVCELQGGWFSTVGRSLSEDNYLDGRHARGMALMAMAGGATGLNYYMFFGGTHFAGWGARTMTTSYDYGAALKENGGTGEKFLTTKAIGEFLAIHGSRLTRSVPVGFSTDNTSKDLIIGMRRATDGTQYIFVLNKDKKATFSDEINLKLTNQQPIRFRCELGALDSKVLVLNTGETNGSKGEWFPKEQNEILRPKKIPASVRITTAYKQNETFKARWTPLGSAVSLPELGVNDCRYSLYKSKFNLTVEELKKYGSIVFDMFTGDPMYIQINGKIAPRASINEFDNTFISKGLLHAGTNEIVAVYENQGHAHGYRPMEELSGMRNGGLGPEVESITPVEQWKVKLAASDNEKDILKASTNEDNWEKMMLDDETVAGLATLQIAGLAKPKWPAAWILQGKNATAVYRSQINFTPEMIKNGKTMLEFGCIDDRGVLYVNGKLVASHDEWDKPFIANIVDFIKPGANQIVMAVTNSNGSGGILKPVRLLRQMKIEKPLKWEVAKDLSGVTNGWITGCSNTKGWEKIALDTVNSIPRKGNNIQPKGIYDALFTWYKVEFELPESENGVWIPWRLLINASGNGYMWLNGHNIGRHWEVGPQREFYLPECWLNFGKGKKNVLVFGLRQSANGAKLKSVEIAPYANDAEMRETK